MQKFKIEYEILANNKAHALDRLDEYVHRAIAEDSTVKNLGFTVVPMHKSSSPDFELPDSSYCYYIRNDSGVRFACVIFDRCLVLIDGRPVRGPWGRGISICSDHDGFSRVEAKARAYTRMMAALISGRSSHRIYPFKYLSAAEFLEKICAEDSGYTPADMIYKSGHDVLLSPYETRLVQGRKDAKDIAALPTKERIRSGSATLADLLCGASKIQG